MHAESETVRAAVEGTIEGMSADQLAWRPEGKWCAAQILEHLSLTYSGTAKGLRRVLETGKVEVRLPTWRERCRVFVLVGLGYFPTGREAPQQVRPRDENPQRALNEIQVNLSQMDKALTACEQQFGSGAVVLTHPIL